MHLTIAAINPQSHSHLDGCNVQFGAWLGRGEPCLPSGPWVPPPWNLGLPTCCRQPGLALASGCCRRLREGRREEPTAAPPARERGGSGEGRCLRRAGAGARREGHGQILAGGYVPVGSSACARCLENLILRGTRQLFFILVLSYLSRAWGGSVLHVGEHPLASAEVGPLSLTYCWKPALSLWIAEVRAAQINANLLTANKHTKWKLLKKSILKK